jgi:hypothetical protein
MRDACLPLLPAALDDCSAQGEQPQALSALHGLCGWVEDCLGGRRESVELRRLQRGDPVALEAVRAVATGAPRPGRAVVGRGTHRDACAGWEALAREFCLQTDLADEVQLYRRAPNREVELVAIELLADTGPDYLKSAGGAMARLFFL